MRRPGWLIGAAAGLAMLVGGCGQDSRAPTDGDQSPPEDPPPLLGTWESRGSDPQLGEVTVRVFLKESGELDVALLLAGGGQLRFSGTWETVGDSLFLRGAYFQPDGEARAAWAVEGDSLLVLSQGPGAIQQWRRP